jgi:DNA-binding MarR family transcriptional regulator
MQSFDSTSNMGHIDAKAINAHCSCFSLRKATRAMTQFYDHALSPAGIRSTQFNLLVTMASVSARTLTEMASVLVMDRTTLTRNLKPLEKLGLIHTVTPRDKRSKAYALTQEGRDTLQKALPLWQHTQTRIREGVGEERFQRLAHELEALTRFIGEL